PASRSWIAKPSPFAAEKFRGWLGTARRDGGGVSSVARRRAVISDVLPCGSVAVAVMIGRPAGAANGTVKTACPLASVVTTIDPRKSSASPAPSALEAALAKTLMRNVVSGKLPPSQPWRRPSAVMTMIGKFWRLFGPWRGEGAL